MGIYYFTVFCHTDIGLPTMMAQAAVRRDPIIARLEARIANFTGIAPHEEEDMLSIAKIKSRVHLGRCTCSCVCEIASVDTA